ncbi:HtaA domain-containing protein [Streptomyces sp. NPDC059582]|uniref:HtaA domain-containing protein n=1 Tax=Streptomyces sp. NPDC059582 TaxID=3346875 RepID=UPI00368FD0D0
MTGAGTSVALGNRPARLTSQGARSFAGYYTAGTRLDPVSLAVDVRAARKASGSPTPTPTKSAAATKNPKGGAIEDGAVDWGVRRTFREYVTGDMANGRWTLSSGAQDGGALFRFPSGEGTYAKGDLTARFAGAVRFTGAHGLDLALSGFRATVDDGEGTLYADVASAGLTGKKVALVTFTAKALKDDDGLPSGGSGGTGTSGGSGGSGSRTDGGSSVGSTTGGTIGGSMASTGSDVPVAAVGALGAATVAAGAAVVFAMRRRRTEA